MITYSADFDNSEVTEIDRIHDLFNKNSRLKKTIKLTSFYTDRTDNKKVTILLESTSENDAALELILKTGILSAYKEKFKKVTL